MAELSFKERLQPSLLDRLTDEDPLKKVESRTQRVITIQKLRECVLRDMAWLLNTGALNSLHDLSDFPYVSQSVVNYGLPDLAGMAVTSMDPVNIEKSVRQAILNFEPRILKNNLKVKMFVNENQMNKNAVTFDIEGELWAQPVPLHFLLKTELDLETGAVNVNESSGVRSA